MVQIYISNCSTVICLISSENVVSLAWMPGSIRHKAGSSSEVLGAPSGRTSVLLKQKAHLYFQF